MHILNDIAMGMLNGFYTVNFWLSDLTGWPADWFALGLALCAALLGVYLLRRLWRLVRKS